MDIQKEKLLELVNKNLTQRQIASVLNTSHTNIRYWLNKYQIKTKRGPKGKIPKDFNRKRKCKCGETDPTKFYGNKTSICSKCHNTYQINKGKNNREWAISFLGKKCRHCGFNKHSCALDIHHLDPKIKDMGFKHMRYWSLDRLKKELKNCILLCKNCHAIEHNRDVGKLG